MNDIELLNNIKQDYGLVGKGITASGKKTRGRPRKVKQSVNMSGDGFGDFIKNIITLPIRMLTGGGMNSMSDAELYEKLKMNGSGKEIDFIKMLFNMFKNMKDNLGDNLYKSDEEIAAQSNRYKPNVVRASGITASGVSASGITASGKRKYVKGKGILKDVLGIASKVANISPFTDVVSSTPLAQIIGKDKLDDIVINKVAKLVGVGKRGRPRKVQETEKQPKKKGKSTKKMDAYRKFVKSYANKHNLKLKEAMIAIKQNGLWKK